MGLTPNAATTENAMERRGSMVWEAFVAGHGEIVGRPVGEIVGAYPPSAFGLASIGDLPQIVYKRSDEALAGSVVLHTDAALLATLAAGQAYLFEIVAFWHGACGIRFAISGPPADSLIYHVDQLDHYQGLAMRFESAVLGAYDIESPYDTAQDTGGATGGPSTGVARMTGTVEVGGVGGNLGFRWAQRVASPTELLVRRGSYMRLQKILLTGPQS
jgi:hypothetical protein